MVSDSEPTVRALKCPQCGGSLPRGSEGYVICPYCGSSLVCGQPGAQAGNAQGAAARGMRLKPFAAVDREGTGLELFRMLLPTGWNTRGGCRWLLDNPGMPATVAFQAWNPQGAEMFEILPNMNLLWNDNPMARGMHPVGSRYFGAEVRPPLGIQEAMQSLVLPRCRSNVQNLQILSFEPQPDLPRLVRSEAPVSGGWAEGGKVRVRYTWHNWELDEDIYGVVEVFRAPLASMLGPSEILIWFVDYLFLFRAAAGRLDAAADLFSLLIGSFRLNPEWYAALKSVAQFLAQRQIQRIHHIGQIGEILAQAGRQMREQNLSDWYARQEIYDRLATDRSRSLRGVDAFLDPHRQEVVELPSGYGHAWANNLGEYIVTQDPTFNPNLSSNLHWEPMPQQ